MNSRFLFYLWQDAQEFLRCIMDQLHEELKQPVPSLAEDSESSDSDDDKPNHHNKRLLGGTALPYSKTFQNGMDVDTLPKCLQFVRVRQLVKRKEKKNYLLLSLFLFLNFSCWWKWGDA